MGTEHHAVVGICIDEADARDFKAMPDSLGTSRPEQSDMRGLLARLRDEAWINGNDCPSIFAKEPLDKGNIKFEPVYGL